MVGARFPWSGTGFRVTILPWGDDLDLVLLEQMK